MISASQLLELSLAIGEDLDLRKNCRHFSETVSSIMETTSTSVWLRHQVLTEGGFTSGEEAEDLAILLHGTPPEFFTTTRIPFDHPVFGVLAEQPALSADQEHPSFYALRTERSIHSGVATIFALGDLGFLHLYSSFRQGVFTKSEMEQLGEVVAKFRQSLEGSLAYHRLTREVTLRRRAESRLQQREEHFRALIGGGLDLILVLEYDARISFASPSFQRTLGWPPEDLVGTNFFELVHPDEVSGHFQAFLEQVKLPGGGIPAEMRLRHADDSWRSFAVSSNNLLSKPSVGGIILNCHDVTERKAWTRALEDAREKALEASRAKTAFVANMSHEIRNPLNGVVGMAGLLLESNLTAEQRACVGTIRTSATTLTTIISDILDFSRIESGKLELTEEPFDIRECVESTLDMVASGDGAEGLELVCGFESDLPRVVLGDPTRFRQVLLNLLSNAVKFTSEGEVVVRVGSTPIEDQGLELHLEVRDTGIGIDPEQAKRLFQPFTQADRSTTRKYGGTGLGLAISYRLCELMGGRIWIEHPSGPGAQIDFTVRVRIPRAEVGKAPFSPDLKGHHILLVDDNETLLEILGDHLESLGLEVVRCASSSAAMAEIRTEEAPDAALVDMSLPDIDGSELAREMLAYRPELPVVLIRPPSARFGTDEHIAARLAKPVKIDLVNQVMAQILGKAPLSGAIHDPEDADDQTVPLGLKVLVAEDYAVSRKVAEMMLARLGCQVMCVEDGQSAVDAVATEDFDLVLMDVQMPDMDGFEATRRIHQLTGPRPRIVALTAHATEADRERCLAAGMDAFLSKPIRLVSLRAVLLEQAVDGTEIPAFDQGRLAVLEAGGGPEMLNELIRLFLDDLPVQLERIERAMREEDRDTLCDAAHKVKGASANLGITRVADAAAVLEDNGADCEFSELAALTNFLRSSIEQARPSIESKIRGWNPETRENR